MKSVFNPGTGKWEIGWPGRVSKHDVVYLSPPDDPMRGMPIGNGDIGVLCWCEDSKIILAVNKCDLWDDAKFGRFHNWKAEEEDHNTTLRHAGRIIIDFKMPIFNLFYLSNFKGRISLADASLGMTVSGPLGSVSFKAFVGHDDGIICCETKSNLKENIPVEITVERYGSMTFSHWYRLINRDAAIGLDGTDSSFDEEGVYLSHTLTGGKFAMGLQISDKGGLTTLYSREHSHSAKAEVCGDVRKRFAFVAAVTSPLPKDAVRVVKGKLALARDEGAPKLFAAHKRAWKTFWMRSLMEYGDDYLDNLWHLTMYYANASQRGKYPGRFINGLWTWNRDVQPWNFYFHWNQQQVYWPLNAAGHHDLLDSYLEYRFNALPYAKKDASEFFKTKGAVVSDVCERRGYNSAAEFLNHTPVAQIAMDFWRQYCFTGNMDFLKKRALPYILEAAYFFEPLFKKGKDGQYHARESTGYEGWIKLRDGITEIACARALFSAVIRALKEADVKEPRMAKWQAILDNLVPCPTIRPEKAMMCKKKGSMKYNIGFFKGEVAVSDRILAAGFGSKERRWLTSIIPDKRTQKPLNDLYKIIQTLEANKTPTTGIIEDRKCNDGIFPWVEYCPVFPSGLIGLSQKNTYLFKAAVNTAKLFAPDGMGWDALPIVLARLGLSRELAGILGHWPGRWQWFCNGFGREGPRDIAKAESALRFRTSLVRDAGIPEGEWKHYLPVSGEDDGNFSFPTWPFRHMGMEPMSILASAMNESLLQSYDGIIRVVPAITNGQNARFTLHALDGFVVSAEIKNGKLIWVSTRSLLGKICRVENPWAKSYLYKNGKRSGCLKQKIIEFPTQKSDIFMIVPEEKIMRKWKTMPVKYQKNEEPKTASCGNATLGLPRMF